MRIWLKATLLAIMIAIGLLLITALFALFFSWRYFNLMSKSAGVMPSELFSRVKTGLSKESKQKVTSFLILGTDQVDGRNSKALLTDSMILASINTQTGAIKLLSLPRDLWSKNYKTKINAFYSYGIEENPDHPEEYVEQKLKEMLGVNIDYTIVVTLDDLEEIVDDLGGIKVNVPLAFTDHFFPADPQSSKSNNLYQTISFDKGEQLMDGKRVLQYIRSRQSQSEAGTDNNRSERQQLVIKSIVAKMKQKDTLKKSKLIGRLFKIYLTKYDSSLPLEDLISLAKQLWPVRKQIQLSTHSLDIFPDNQSASISHPPTWQYNGQWVYEIIDQDQLQVEIQTKLGLK